MEKSKISKKQSDELYKLFKFIHDTFVKNKITYFMVGGTLLGAIRHQGVIPWDDDGDLCIFKEDVPKLRKLIPFFKQNGYRLTDNPENKDRRECLSRKDSCTWMISCNRQNCLGVDLFVMYREKGQVTYYDPYWETAENGGKKCHFKESLMFPLLPYRFGNFYLYGPHNPVEHLNRCYGNDWSSKGQVLYDHRRGVWINSEKRHLKEDEFLSFNPPSKTCDTKVPNVKCVIEENVWSSSPKSSPKKSGSKKTSKKNSAKKSRDLKNSKNKSSKKRSVKRSSKKMSKPKTSRKSSLKLSSKRIRKNSKLK